jgi:hypothetical protein
VAQSAHQTVWVKRLEAIDAELASGALSLSQLKNPPPPPLFEDVRAKVAADPPLEGAAVTKELLKSNNVVMGIYAVCAVGCFVAELIQISVKYELSLWLVASAAIITACRAIHHVFRPRRVTERGIAPVACLESRFRAECPANRF